MTAPEDPSPEPDMTADSPAAPASGLSADERAAWGARFGWVAGAIAGLFAGFGATLLCEVLVLRARYGAAAAPLGSRLSSILVPGFFLTGALMGHGFGARTGASRYGALGTAAGLAVASLLLAWMMLAR